MTPRPDLAAQVAPGPIAIEVELQRKNQARLYGILSMYADKTDGDEAPLAGVIYITGNDDIDRLVRRLAVHADLTSPKAELQDARSGRRADTRDRPRDARSSQRVDQALS